MSKKDKDKSGWIDFILDILEEIIDLITDIFD